MVRTYCFFDGETEGRKFGIAFEFRFRGESTHALKEVKRIFLSKGGVFSGVIQSKRSPRGRVGWRRSGRYEAWIAHVGIGA